MSVQARIMGIADIFEALTARDRPYKQGMKLSQAVSILARISPTTAILTRDLFEVFVRDGVYLKYAQTFLDPKQIDPVDDQAMLLAAKMS
jgi:HD-GYP domain-containing protein (c-di-GMP phosphodiesterase class II)